MEKVLIAVLILSLIGGFMIVCTRAMVRFQVWSQRVVMGAQYIPSKRTYIAMRIVGVFLIILAGGVLVLYQYQQLTVAHSTFENYYAFRGCQTLVDRTDTYGDCKLADGSTIKIVLINGKWYLDGDGPGVW